MNPGSLYKIIVEDLGFINKTTGLVCMLPQETILTCVETKCGQGGEESYFFANDTIFYRQIYKLDEWMVELNYCN